MTRWYCIYCNKYFESDTTEPICPLCLKTSGKWSEIIKRTKVCKICSKVLDDSYRVRLDEKMPNGSEIHRPEGSEVFEHFSEEHPDFIVKAMKELGFAK